MCNLFQFILQQYMGNANQIKPQNTILDNILSKWDKLIRFPGSIPGDII